MAVWNVFLGEIEWKGRGSHLCTFNEHVWKSMSRAWAEHESSMSNPHGGDMIAEVGFVVRKMERWSVDLEPHYG